MRRPTSGVNPKSHTVREMIIRRQGQAKRRKVFLTCRWKLEEIEIILDG
jgi:hypothetical protein